MVNSCPLENGKAGSNNVMGYLSPKNKSKKY